MTRRARLLAAGLALFCAFLASASFARPAQAIKPAQRIVSLMPSLTEDLFALGAGSRVLAVSQFTTYPREAARLPQVASFSAIDAERIVRLHPDLVVGITAQRPRVAPLERAGIRVVLYNDDGYDDLFRSLLGLGAETGRSGAARALIGSLRAREARLRQSVSSARHPSAFVVLSVAPVYTVGRPSYISTLIEKAGGRNAARLDVAYERYSPEALLALQPDVLIADPQSGLKTVLDREPWRSLRAVRNHHVAFLPDDTLLRPGPRYNEGLGWLIALFKRIPEEAP